MSGPFDRHGLIPGWRQENLSAATVIVAGLGALGNEVTSILAMSGVGRMILCDPDHVDGSNLSRTILFRHRDIGRSKVDVAADALRDLAPGLTLDVRPAFFQRAVGLAELRRASLVLSCLDSHAARVNLTSRCSLVGTPYIDGGTHPWGGEVRVFVDPAGPCYGCGLTPAERADADVPQSCIPSRAAEPTGAAAPSSALVGSWSACMAVRYLMGLSVPAGTIRIDLSRGTTATVEIARDAECPFHTRLPVSRRLAISASTTIGELLMNLDPEAAPLLWYPVAVLRRCSLCGFQDEPWRPDAAAACPACGTPLLPRSTLNLRAAPRNATLRELGVPEEEILAVRTPEGIRYVELSPSAAASRR